MYSTVNQKVREGHLEVNEEDVEELVEQHSKDLTTEDLEELKKQLNQERVLIRGGGQQ